MRLVFPFRSRCSLRHRADAGYLQRGALFAKARESMFGNLEHFKK
jgi:hypothetical protein